MSHFLRARTSDAWLLGFILLLVFSPLTSVSASAVYVSQHGSDSNDGSVDHPFASPARAQEAVRESSTTKTVVIEPGTYYLSQPLDFNSADSGETWQGAPGQSVISGGIPITGWKAAGGGIFTAPTDMPVGLDLSVDGERLMPASIGFDVSRPFVTGWRLIDSSRAIPVQPKTFNVFAADLTASAKKSGAIVQIMDSSRNTDQFVVANSYNTVNSTLSFTGNASAPAGGSWRVLADPDDLQGIGQFAYDSLNKIVYIKLGPGSAVGQKSKIIAAQLDTLISINGTTNFNLVGLNFSDTNSPRVGYTDYAGIAYNPVPIAAIIATNMTNSSITDSNFLNVGNGLVLINSPENRITHNNFDHLGGTGILVKSHSDYVTVSQNVLTSLGNINAGSAGIVVQQSADDLIDRNYVDGVGRWGIDLTPDAVGSLTDVTVSNNILLNTSQQTDDSAAIYSYAGTENYVGLNSAITGNRIESTGGLSRNSIGTYDMGQSRGIYMDEHVSNVVINKNVILNNSQGIVLCAGCTSNVADNNVSVIQSEPLYDRGVFGVVPASGSMPNSGTIYIDLLPAYFTRGKCTSRLIVQASGTSTDSVPPQITVSIDGKPVGSASVVTGQAGRPGPISQYAFGFAARQQQSHRVSVELVNGSVNGTPTRSLSSLVLYVNDSAIPLSSSPEYGVIAGPSGLPVTHFTVTHNIIYRTLGGGASVSTDTNAYVDPNPGILDDNLIGLQLTKANTLVFGNPSATHADVHSIIGDPIFQNADAEDFRLSPGSPAFTVGFSTLGVPLAPYAFPTATHCFQAESM